MSSGDVLCQFVNDARGGKGMEPLMVPMGEEELSNAYFTQCSFTQAASEDVTSEDDMLEALKKTVVDSLAEEGHQMVNFAFTSNATHVDAMIDTSNPEEFKATVTFYYKYLNLASIGQVIDGDLVVEGSCINAKYGPHLCVV